MKRMFLPPLPLTPTLSRKGRGKTVAYRQPDRHRLKPISAAAVLLLVAACTAGTHVPPFARVPFEPFSRDAVVAITLREWRAFGSVIAPTDPVEKPERQQGLWQRVGEYWWLGLDLSTPDASWTGKHDARGRVFPPERDEAFAWSAAFVSYVMRMAGAGFPYSASHDAYIHAALRGDPAWAIAAERPEAYAPRPGDLICAGREESADLGFDDLPSTPAFEGHCDIVVATGGPEGLAAIGGNVWDAVALRHFPVAPGGRLVQADPAVKWLAVLRLREKASLLPPG